MLDPTASAPAGRRGLADHLIDALTDPRRRDRAVLGVLIGYCLIWALYGAIAKGSQDIHFDMGEMVAWSREMAFGTPKHPPLPVWLVAGWFAVFPLADWSYYLFAMVLASAALWFAWKLAGDYLPPDKQVAALAVLTLVPFFNFHALKYNANTIMLPLWALATWTFLRSFETRRIDYAALAGLSAAAAMLGKYWAVILLAGLGLAALADPRRRDYFRSPAPWVTIAVGAAALAPHVIWLHLNNYAPFAYALEAHPGTLISALLSGLGYIAGALGMAAAPIALIWLGTRPDRTALADTLWPAEPQRRLVWLAFVLPLVLPTFAAVAAHENIVSIWAFGSMTLLPVVLLASPRIVLPRLALRRIVMIALAVPVIALAAAPVIAIVIHRQGVPNYATHYSGVAHAVAAAWRDTTDRPLRLAGGPNNLLHGMLIYLPGQPSTYEVGLPHLTPWTDAARIARDGIALACPAVDAACLNAVTALAARGPAGKRVEVDVSRSFWGVADKADRFVIVTVPPAN